MSIASIGAIVCPYCGTQHKECLTTFTDKTICGNCDNVFKITTQEATVFITEKTK